MNDVSSEEWERIKDFVGASAAKTSKHPLERELERREAREPQHLADGGPVWSVAPNQNDPFAGQKPLAPAVPPDIAAFMASKAAPSAPPAALPPAPSPVPPAPVPASPGATPPPLDAGLNKEASDIMGGITPETISRLMASLNKQNMAGQIGAGIAGIGDAIQSVGGIKGTNMQAAEDQINKNRDFALKVPGEMAAVGKERYGLTKELGGDEPTSLRSYTAQKANEPLLKQMGFTPEQIKAMPASLIDGIRSGAIDREKALAQIQSDYDLKMAGMNIQKGQAENTAANDRMMRELQRRGLDQAADKEAADEKDAEDKKRREAADALAKRGINATVMDWIPGTAGHDAAKVLKEQAAGQNSGGPLGQTTVRDGKIYEWSSATGKYHLKQ